MGKRVKAAGSDEEDAESDTALKGTSKPRAKKARKVGIEEPEPEKDRPKKKRKSIFDYSSDEDDEEEEEVVIKPATKRVPKPPKPTQPRKAKDSGAAEDKDTGPAKSDNAAKPEKQKPAKPAPKPVEEGPISLSSDSETGDEQPRRRVSSKPAKTLSAVAAKQKPSTPKRTLPDPEEETIDFDFSDGDADSSKPVPKSSSAGDTLVSKPKPSASGEPKKRGITAFLVPFSQMAKPPSSQDQVERVPCTELWVDKHAPGRTKELAVHAKKVDEVREWVGGSLGRAGRRERRPRIFFLTGPSGSGKTATVRAVCQELGVGISEWINPESESSRTELSIDTDSLSLRFSDFLRQASRFGSSGLDFVGSSLEPNDSTPTIILIEDIPNIASSPSLRAAFHASLLNYAQSSSRTPLILIASDVGSGWDDSERDSVITPRTVLPAQLRSSIAATITELKFNPVAHSLLVTMLKSLAEKERQGIGRSVTPEEIDVLASRSGGDLRCAINALQFMALLDTKVTSPDKGKKEKGRKKIEERVREAEKRVGQAVGNGRESTLPLFHALGKVLYNKRREVGDEESSEKKPPPLKPRDAVLTFVPEDVIEAAQMPPNVLVLHLAQNYPTFFASAEELSDAADALSQSDDFLSRLHSHGEVAGNYGSVVATRGLLYAHEKPVPTEIPPQLMGRNRQRTLHKPEFWAKNREAIENSEMVMAITHGQLPLDGSNMGNGVRRLGGAQDLALEVLPFYGLMRPGVQQRSGRFGRAWQPPTQGFRRGADVDSLISSFTRFKFKGDSGLSNQEAVDEGKMAIDAIREQRAIEGVQDDPTPQPARAPDPGAPLSDALQVSPVTVERIEPEPVILRAWDPQDPIDDFSDSEDGPPKPVTDELQDFDDFEDDDMDDALAAVDLDQIAACVN